MKSLKLMLILLGVVILAAACGGAGTTPQEAAVAPAVQAAVQDTPKAEAAVAPDAPVAAATPEVVSAGAALSESYDDALSIRNQLAYGTLQLEGGAEAVTLAQAAQLLPLWQAVSLLSASASAAPEELAALQDQIAAAMTPAQIAAIAQMQLTNTALQAYYVEIGVSQGLTPEPGVTPQSGSMRDVPPEQRESVRATAQALGTPVGNGSGGGSSKRSALLENVIQLLTERAAQ